MELYYSSEEDVESIDELLDDNNESDDVEELKLSFDVNQVVKTIQAMTDSRPINLTSAEIPEYVEFTGPVETSIRPMEDTFGMLIEEGTKNDEEIMDLFLRHMESTELLEQQAQRYGVQVAKSDQEFLSVHNLYLESKEVSQISSITAIKSIKRTLGVGTTLGVIIIFGLNGEDPYPLGSVTTQDPVVAIDYSEEADLLVSAHESGKISIWNPNIRGIQEGTHFQLPDRISIVKFLQPNSIAVCSSAGAIMLQYNASIWSTSPIPFLPASEYGEIVDFHVTDSYFSVTAFRNGYSIFYFKADRSFERRIDKDFASRPIHAIHRADDIVKLAVFDSNEERISIYEHGVFSGETTEKSTIETKGAPIALSWISDHQLALLSLHETSHADFEEHEPAITLQLLELEMNKKSAYRKIEFPQSELSLKSRLYCDLSPGLMHFAYNNFVSSARLLTLKERVRLMSKSGRWPEALEFALSALQHQEEKIKELSMSKNWNYQRDQQCSDTIEEIKALIAKEIQHFVAEENMDTEVQAELSVYYSIRIGRIDLIFGKIYEAFSRHNAKLFFKTMLQFLQGHRSVIEKYPSVKGLIKNISIYSDTLKKFITEHTSYGQDMDALFAFSEVIYRNEQDRAELLKLYSDNDLFRLYLTGLNELSATEFKKRIQNFLETRRDAPSFGSKLVAVMEFLRNISMDRHHLSPFRKDLVLLLITPDEVINEGYCPLLYDLFISYVASSTQSVRRRRLFFRFQDDIARSIAEHVDRDSFFIHRIHTCIAFEKQHLIPSELQSEYLLLFALILRYQKLQTDTDYILWPQSTTSAPKTILQKRIIEVLINSLRAAEGADLELKRDIGAKIDGIIKDEILPTKMFEDEMKESRFFISSLSIASAIYEKLQHGLEQKSRTQVEKYVSFFQAKLETNVGLELYSESNRELWREVATTFRRNIEHYPEVPGKKLVIEMIRRTSGDSLNPLLLFFYYYVRSDEQRDSLVNFCRDYRVPYEEFFYLTLRIYIQIFKSGGDLSNSGRDPVVDFIMYQDEKLDAIDLDICLSICSSHRMAKAILLSKKNAKYKAVQEIMKNVEQKLRELRISLNESGRYRTLPNEIDLTNLDIISDESHVVNPNQFIEDQIDPTVTTEIEFPIEQTGTTGQFIDVLEYIPFQELMRNVRHGLRICKEASDQSQLNEQQLQAMWLLILERFLVEQNLLRVTTEHTSERPIPKSMSQAVLQSQKKASVDELFGVSDDDTVDEEDVEDEVVVSKRIEKLQQIILETQNEVADTQKEIDTANVDKQKKMELERRKILKQNFLKRKHEEKEIHERKLREIQENSKKRTEEMNLCDPAKYWLLRCVGYVIRVVLNEMIKVIPVPFILETYSRINGAIQFGPLKKIVMRMLEIYRNKHTLLEKQSALLQNDTLIDGNRYYLERMSAATPKNFFDICYDVNCQFKGSKMYDLPTRLFRCGHSFHRICAGGKLQRCSMCQKSVDEEQENHEEEEAKVAELKQEQKKEQERKFKEKYEFYTNIDKYFGKRANLETLNLVIENSSLQYRLITANIRGDNTTDSEHALLLHPAPVTSSQQVSQRLWGSAPELEAKITETAETDQRYKYLTENPILAVESIPIINLNDVTNRITGQADSSLPSSFFWLDNLYDS